MKKVYCKECKHYFRNLDGNPDCCIWVRGNYIEESPLQKEHFEEKKTYNDPLIKNKYNNCFDYAKDVRSYDYEYYISIIIYIFCIVLIGFIVSIIANIIAR
jgi:hypothetical protein